MAVTVSSMIDGNGRSRSHFSRLASSTSLARGSMRSSHLVKCSSIMSSSARYTGNRSCSETQPLANAFTTIESKKKTNASTTTIASQSGHATRKPSFCFGRLRVYAEPFSISPTSSSTLLSSSPVPSRCPRAGRRRAEGPRSVTGVVRNRTSGESRYTRMIEKTSGFRIACAQTSMQPTQNVAQHTSETTSTWSRKSPLLRSRSEYSALELALTLGGIGGS